MVRGRKDGGPDGQRDGGKGCGEDVKDRRKGRGRTDRVTDGKPGQEGKG